MTHMRNSWGVEINEEAPGTLLQWLKVTTVILQIYVNRKHAAMYVWCVILFRIFFILVVWDINCEWLLIKEKNIIHYVTVNDC